MSKYDFSISTAITKGGKKFTTQEPSTWHDVDDVGLGALIGLASSVETEVKNAQNKGGDIAITLTSKITALDGGQVPPGAGSKTYSGINRHGLSDVQEAMLDVAKKLAKLGRDAADRKDGKRGGGHGHGGRDRDGR